MELISPGLELISLGMEHISQIMEHISPGNIGNLFSMVEYFSCKFLMK